MRQTATTLGDIVYMLNSSAGTSEWRGRAADAFRESFDDDFRPKVEKARDSFSRAAGALEDWADHMLEAQQDARNLEAEAQEAQRALAALPELIPVNPFAPPDEEPDEAAQAERAQLERDHEQAQQHLDDIRSRASTLAIDYTEYGETIADRLNEAGDIAPNKPGWLSSIGDAIGDMLDTLQDIATDVLHNIGNWIRERAADLVKFADVLLTFASVYSKIARVLDAVARMIPLPQARLYLDAVSKGLRMSALTLRITAGLAYGAAEWGGADVDYPWEDLEFPWDASFWEGSYDTRPMEMDGFQFQGGAIEPTTGESQDVQFAPAQTSRAGLAGAVNADDARYLGLNDPPPTAIALPNAPLQQSFDSAWNAGEAA
ncbi:WXG100 family type VII secretion target [Streptomyces litchfieldiae]|uniref:WXG100 family type VII secretion target n=1 Tax=Streptomyces litchfieldiae TaxID=3075543 RepID=A0ABU2MNP0_9ACTN|nr:hypothetical protein [Streptomyces sp. DSM 44938]MDT0343233.1 hypothetical protein [Streptomyces sp. DSM 44938]